MQLIVEIGRVLRDTLRDLVGVYRLLPVADAREDMRRHMLRVRSVRRDLGVELRRIETFFRDRRIVVEMDQIVCDARMLRLTRKYRLEDRGAFELVRVGLVGRRCRSIERQRVVDLDLIVIRKALRQLFHGLGIGLDARPVIDLVVFGVHDRKRIDEAALALGLGADALSFGDRGRAFGKIFRRRRDVGIEQQAQRNAPIGNPAFGIGLQHVFENLLRCAVPERVLVQHGLVEEFLRLRRARRFEMHLAELAVVGSRGSRLGQ